jgi:hypothetical protein
MPALIYEAPSPHLANFIDAISKLIAAVFNGDLSVAPRQITAIDVSNTRH